MLSINYASLLSSCLLSQANFSFLFFFKPLFSSHSNVSVLGHPGYVRSTSLVVTGLCPHDFHKKRPATHSRKWKTWAYHLSTFQRKTQSIFWVVLLDTELSRTLTGLEHWNQGKIILSFVYNLTKNCSPFQKIMLLVVFKTSTT